jgi:predicted RNase H-like HicB family nuclease
VGFEVEGGAVEAVPMGRWDKGLLAGLKSRCYDSDMVFHVTLNKAEDGWIVAECPALPGCVSQGRTEQEALENIKEAIAAWLWAEDQKAARSGEPGKPEILVTV